MFTNSLEIFKQLFLKNPTNIKAIFTNVTTFVKDKDRAIADFLAVEYPELIWLIRVLYVKYEKQFSSNIPSQRQLVETIARLITLTVDETGILDYDQKDHNNLVYNTLETHLSPSLHHNKQLNQDNEDIISIDGSVPDMNLVYQHTTTFEDIVSHNCTLQSNSNELSNAKPDNHLSYPKKQQPDLHDASSNTAPNKQIQDVLVIQHPCHVTRSNTNDVIDVAQLVDQVVTSRGEQQTLRDSIHSPKGPSVVNLSLTDLRHRLNALRHNHLQID